jgi:CheY-like chemotaxis protein
LIADDDPDVLQLWTRLLRSYDGALEIATASDGTQTLAALRAARPDLVLLDILMPGLDGWQVLALKRRDEAICDVPVILVSAQDPTEKPPASQALLITMGEGIPLRKLLRCALELSALLLKPE